MNQLQKPSFEADHHAPVHPNIMQAIIEAQTGYAESYGDDAFTIAATEQLQQAFGTTGEVYFVGGGGTAANVTALRGMTPPGTFIVATDMSHINNFEAGGIEYATRSPIRPLESVHGKLDRDMFASMLGGTYDKHTGRPGVVSITQPSEVGTVYTPEEIRDIVDLAHEKDVLVHMDGARIFNAAARLGIGLADFTTTLGVDVISVGAGKNGGLGIGEAVVFANPEVGRNLDLLIKQMGFVVTKARLITPQWSVLLQDDFGLQLAAHSNAMAGRLGQGIKDAPINVTEEVQTNGVWGVMEVDRAEELRDQFAFEDWDPSTNLYRFMTSYCTTIEEVDAFTAAANKLK